MVSLAAALACAMVTMRNINTSTGDFRERTIESVAPTFARADDDPTAPASYSFCGLARTPQDSRIFWIFVGARGDELPPRVHASRPPPARRQPVAPPPASSDHPRHIPSSSLLCAPCAVAPFWPTGRPRAHRTPPLHCPLLGRDPFASIPPASHAAWHDPDRSAPAAGPSPPFPP